VLCGEHGNEDQADGAAQHAKCLRVRPRKTCETGRSQLRVNEWFVPFLSTNNTAALEFGHILASSCQGLVKAFKELAARARQNFLSPSVLHNCVRSTQPGFRRGRTPRENKACAFLQGPVSRLASAWNVVSQDNTLLSA
jgi:hypothetical protein